MQTMTAKHQQYRRMRRWRKVWVGLFFPLALALLILTRTGITGLPAVLGWPVMLVFVVLYVMGFQLTDKCPWCEKSFHTGWQQGTTHTGFRALVATNCANCGAPASLDDQRQHEIEG